MDSGFEALPPRQTGRHAKRKRPVDSSLAAKSSEQPPQRAPADDDDAAVSAASLVYSARHDVPQFEYLDHTADVQIHSWGDSIGETFLSSALGMFGYMTDVSGVDVDPTCSRIITARGRDVISLFYNFLDACLFEFSGDDFVAKDMNLLECNTDAAGSDAGDRACWIRVEAFGERFSLDKHDQGTEIKAITYSNMQVFTSDGAAYFADGKDDVEAAAEPAEADGAAASGGGGGAAAASKNRGKVDAYVIVDI